MDKATKLAQEIEAKFQVLAQEDWEAACCDKSVEGLMKRTTNLKEKCLEECDTEGSSKLTPLYTSLSAMMGFGIALKKTKRSKANLTSGTAFPSLVAPNEKHEE